MKQLLRDGAVPDTWAPNGSSALMLAAAANNPEALAVLLQVRAHVHGCILPCVVLTGGHTFSLPSL